MCFTIYISLTIISIAKLHNVAKHYFQRQLRLMFIHANVAETEVKRICNTNFFIFFIIFLQYYLAYWIAMCPPAMIGIL